MIKRNALLVGVPQYDDNPKWDLPVVARDISLMQDALEQSEYTVDVLGIGANHTTRSRVRKAIRKACRQSGAETLLLYFSGHGVNYKGKDYLMPWDANDTSHSVEKLECSQTLARNRIYKRPPPFRI